MTTISSSRRFTSALTSSSSSNRQPPPGALELEQKLRTSGLSEDQVKSTMKTLFGERGAGGGGTLTGTEGAGSKDFALKLQSALMGAGVSDADAQGVVSSVGSANGSTASSSTSASTDATTGKVDSFDASSTASQQTPAGAEELERRLRSAGLSDEQVKATMKKLFGERGANAGGTLDGTEGAGSQGFALKLQSALMSAGLSDGGAQRVVSGVGSSSGTSKWGYSGVSSFE